MSASDKTANGSGAERTTTPGTGRSASSSALLAYLTAIGVVVILGAVVGLAWYESSSCGKSEIGHLPLPPGGMTITYRHLAADEQRARQVIAGVLAALSKDRGEPQIKRLFCKPICKRDAVEQDGGSDPAAAAGC